MHIHVILVTGLKLYYSTLLMAEEGFVSWGEEQF